MAVFNEPTKWQTSLVNSGDANIIPQNTPAGTGEASFEDGFPQITQIPLGAGGQAPDRKDFNGLFKVLGDSIFYMQNGGLPTYSESFDYVVGRVVSYNDNIYKCIQANGASSTVVAPDSNTEYWQRIDNFVRSVNGVNADTSGNVTLDISSGATVVETYVNDSDWYRIWSDGWLEQGGTSGDATAIGTSSNGKDSTVTFLKPFKNAKYSLVATNGGTDANVVRITNDTVAIKDKTATACVINLNAPSGVFINQFTWYACGQGA